VAADQAHIQVYYCYCFTLHCYSASGSHVCTDGHVCTLDRILSKGNSSFLPGGGGGGYGAGGGVGGYGGGARRY
jgi:uncharacterized membrane protein